MMCTEVSPFTVNLDLNGDILIEAKAEDSANRPHKVIQPGGALSQDNLIFLNFDIDAV